MNKQDMKNYVQEKLAKMNDYSFMDTDFVKVVSALVDFEMEYIDSLTPDENGECDYDDDAAFDYILAGMNKDFSAYKMYLECLVDDYLEVSESYLSENGEIDWE
ncbi:MAG: hypothetical protein IJO93_02665 [Clostridia bacterium]|nr:hypothetical protein [Clostridia bacterium]